MSEVVTLPVITTLPVPPDRVLQGALDAHEQRPFRRVIVLAVFEDDGEEYFAFSDSDGGALLWDMERARFRLVKEADAR